MKTNNKSIQKLIESTIKKIRIKVIKYELVENIIITEKGHKVIKSPKYRKYKSFFNKILKVSGNNQKISFKESKNQELEDIQEIITREMNFSQMQNNLLSQKSSFILNSLPLKKLKVSNKKLKVSNKPS